MSKNTVHDDEKVQRDYYGRRWLGSHFPTILRYLDPTGTLVAVVAEESSIAKAGVLARERCGSYQLPFDDDTFDLTYSRVLLDWLREPCEGASGATTCDPIPAGW